MGEIPEWQRSWWKRLQIAVIAGLATPLIRVLAWTWRWRVEGESLLAGVEAGGGHAIHAFWHGRILPATVHFRNRGIVVITSQNFDGEWIARIIGRFGYGTARGSTSRGGPAALRQMIRDVRSNGVAFTLDGPRTGAGRPARRDLVVEGQRGAHRAVPSRGPRLLVAAKLGPHADSEAVHHRRAGVRRPPAGATRRHRRRAGAVADEARRDPGGVRNPMRHNHAINR
jgi:hypothetical protein